MNIVMFRYEHIFIVHTHQLSNFTCAPRLFVQTALELKHLCSPEPEACDTVIIGGITAVAHPKQSDLEGRGPQEVTCNLRSTPNLLG